MKKCFDILLVLMLALLGNVIDEEPSEIAVPAVGDIVTFGCYAGEKLTWQVLEVSDDGSCVMIAEKCIDKIPFNDTEENTVCWENCSLRAWLNGKFYYSAFSADERSRVRTVQNTNPANPEYGTDCGPDTEDKVWLLSAEELEKYFPGNGDRIAVASERAAQSIRVVSQGEIDRDQPGYDYPLKAGACNWALRTMGRGPCFVACVNAAGELNLMGQNFGNAAVRPVVCVK